MTKLSAILLGALLSCQSPVNNPPSSTAIEALNLKKGEIITCGPTIAGFGSVDFLVSASPDIKKEFQQAVAMLHSFEYQEAEKAFAAVIEKDPNCAMAYWGVAMSNFHPLWEPPTKAELEKGARAMQIAEKISDKTKRESAYIDALATFYKDFQTTDHKTRCRNYENAMMQLYTTYPDDEEAAIFYALALNTTADPADKSYRNQKKAGEILANMAKTQPDHPGIIHYIIHTYDNPDLANIALPAARKYAALAPASAHAQHMPSHIFIRLGLWDEAISSNIASVTSAKCYAEKASMEGNFDEELHGMDYLVYAYLQNGDNKLAQEQLDYLKGVKKVSAHNLKVAYAYAAMPARYVLENKKWKDAANLQPYPADFPWSKFPWQNAITVFTRLLGKVNTNDIAGAEQELSELKRLQKQLADQKDEYKVRQLEVQIKTGQAWIHLKKGNHPEAEKLMREAAALEDGTMKHPVTPAEVLPARELLGDMLLTLKKPTEAIEAYKEDLAMHKNRLNGKKGLQLAMDLANTERKVAIR